jgi:hypothetical protein
MLAEFQAFGVGQITAAAPLVATGGHEFTSPRQPRKAYRVTRGCGGTLHVRAQGASGAATANMCGSFAERHMEALGSKREFESDLGL